MSAPPSEKTETSEGVPGTLPPVCVSVPVSGRRHTFRRVPPDAVELPRLAPRGTRWTEGAGGASIPRRAGEESPGQSLPEDDEALNVTTCEDESRTRGSDGEASGPIQVPLTAMEVVHILARNDSFEFQLYYLKEVEGDFSRPYDLRAVRASEAGSEHYVFSPGAVLHVTEGRPGALVSLAQWYRESLAWKALQEIPFFRDFGLHRAFSGWRRNVRKTVFQRRRWDLQDRLLTSVPRFRKALLEFTREIEELRETSRLPQSHTFTLLEFTNLLRTTKQELLQTLEKFSRHRAATLNTVKEDSYLAHQELQLHLQSAKRTAEDCEEALHLQLAHRRQLQRQAARSRGVLLKLGRWAALVDQMTLQSLVSVFQRDVRSILKGVVKRPKPQQGWLFLTQLHLGVSGGLRVEPPIQRFQEAVSQALLEAGHSLIQMCETCGFFLETSDSFFTSDSSQALTSDLSTLERGPFPEESSSRMFCCRLRASTARRLQPPAAAPLSVRGSRLRGCYQRLLKAQLQRHIGTDNLTEQVEKEQADIMQEAERDVQQLCESYAWLTEVHSFLGQWGRASLESLKGRPSALYEQLLEKVGHWTERVLAVPPSISTCNQLFIIQCTGLKERLGLQLRRVEEEVMTLLVQQVKLLSENLTADLEEAAATLETDPRDLLNLSRHALTVRDKEDSSGDVRKRLDYICSLRDTIHMNWRKMTEEEVALQEKMLATWADFLPLLKRAGSVVRSRLPSMVGAVDTVFSYLSRDLNGLVTEATSGPFVDPMQDAKDMASELSGAWTRASGLIAKLEQLSGDSQNLHGRPVDLSRWTTAGQRVKARLELWELRAELSTWMDQWKGLLLSEVVVSQAHGNICEWKERALSLTSVMPTHDAVLQDTLGTLEEFSCRVAVLAELQSPTLKRRHWDAIFKDMGRPSVPQKQVTVAQLTLQQLDHTLVSKVCRDAQVECSMEQTFQELRRGWRARLFQLDRFSLPVWQPGEAQRGQQQACNDASVIVTGLEILFAEMESGLMALSTMRTSPHSVPFRPQMEHWMQSLKDLERQLFLFERYQQLWTFLTKMFHDTCFGGHRVDLLEQFQPVDETFKEMLLTLSSDPRVLNLVQSKKTNDRFHGESLHHILMGGLCTMEAISNRMVPLLETLCDQFPRLWLLSEREVIRLLSFRPTPFTVQGFVRRCFTGVRRLELDCERLPSGNGSGAAPHSSRPMNVLGFFGSLQEHITFTSPLEPHLNVLVWLGVFEKQLRLTMVHRIQQCAAARNQLEPSSRDLSFSQEVGGILFDPAGRRRIVLPVLDLLSRHPLQCLLVAEEAVWCQAVLRALREPNPLRLSNVKAYNSAKLKALGCFMRDGLTGAKPEPLVSRYTMMCLRALVQLTMKHAQQLSRLMEVQCDPESSFEWLSWIKYHVKQGSDDPTCYVDVLGHRLQYDYEYSGPEDWVMVPTPSTDRASLGILLAVMSYRCGFVRGPNMAGKETTTAQLGRALGRQVVAVHCSPSMTAGVVERMLRGAVQTGAWLLLHSAHLLTQQVLSVLGQRLIDIRLSFSTLTTDDNPSDGLTSLWHSELQTVLAGKRVPARRSYGCVLTSSQGETFAVPETLRCATRPVALTHPDYKIITEVALTCIGFSQAASLSRRLVALVQLAHHASRLPEFLSDHQSSYLVVLQKIISAADIHLQQSVRDREISVAGQTGLGPSLGLSAEQGGSGTERPSRCRRSHLSIVQGLMEETAVVKAILSVYLPVLFDQENASQFYIVCKDTFPIASQFPLFQQYFDEEEKMQLKDALTEELQRQRLQADAEILCNALTLYQTVKSSRAVLLLGPPGSGKTTCYRVVAGALNHLAAQAEGHVPASTWSSVQTTVLFPHAMSHQELFGCFCEESGWRDGAVAKALRDSCQRAPPTSPPGDTSRSAHTAAKWLVMDGNPAGRPGWLDYLTAMCGPEWPVLSLASGETLASRSQLKLLVEVTDLREAGPSAVTRCSLVHLAATDLWKAVWKSEMETLVFEDKVDRGTLKVWNLLAEDLFSSTLGLLRQRDLNDGGESLDSATYGLQEITSFVRILRALLQQFWTEVEKDEQIQPVDQPGTTRMHHHVLNIHTSSLLGSATLHSPPDTLQRRGRTLDTDRNLFLAAFIWGFSGNLHPRLRPQFDSLARQVLFSCRYKIVVPDDESVFGYFLNMDSKKTVPTNCITPEYGAHSHLLKLVVEANQPVMLVGERASGKTALCKALLGLDKPHVDLPAGPLLSSRDLRAVLSSIRCRKTREVTRGSAHKQPGLLLFVDDVHKAPCDVFGKVSTALETLRQSISTGNILTFDSYHFHSLSAATVGYMATCCAFGAASCHGNVVSSRLSRLFSTLVLPHLSLDVILSIHSPLLKIWLRDTALQHSGEEMARCIVSATESLYGAVRQRFQAAVPTPHLVFSHHDLHKVFRGMCLWQPNVPNTAVLLDQERWAAGLPAARVLNVAHLWMHECARTFTDRLRSDERETLWSLVAQTAAAHFGSTQAEGWNVDPLQGPEEAALKPPPLQPQLHQHAELAYGPPLSLNLPAHFKRGASYRCRDPQLLLQDLRALVDSKDKGQKGDEDAGVTRRWMVHKQQLHQLLHVLRALLMSAGHGALIASDRDTGRKTTVRLAARLTGCRLMEVHPGNEHELRGILKEAGNRTREDGVHVVLLVHEAVSCSVRAVLLVAMAHPAYPGLYADEELPDLVSRVTAAAESSRRPLMDSWMLETYLNQVHRNVHVFLLLPFTTTAAHSGLHAADLAEALSLSSCVEVYQPWSTGSLVEVATQRLRTEEGGGSEAGLPVAMALIHQSACRYAAVLLGARTFGPQTYTEFIDNFGYLGYHLHNQQQSKADRVATVVSRMEALSSTALQRRLLLRRLQEKVADTLQRQRDLLWAAHLQRRLLQEAQEAFATAETRLRLLEEQIHRAEKPAGPLFLAGLKTLSCLKQEDLEEVRHYRDPPDGVVGVTDAICLLFNRPAGWESARQLLAQSNFFQELEFFERSSVTEEQLEQLGVLVQSPPFAPEAVLEASRACGSLSRWVQAVHQCCRQQRRTEALRRLEAEAAEAACQLRLAEQHLEEELRRQEEAALQIQLVQKELEEKQLELLTAENSERVAASAAEEMETHLRGWRAAAQEVKLEEQSLRGDALLLAAIVSYLGPFGPDVRTEILSKWRQLFETGSIDVNPEDPRTSLFTGPDSTAPRPPPGFPIPASHSPLRPLARAMGLHRAAEAARPLEKLLLWGCNSACARRWPLLVDPQRPPTGTLRLCIHIRVQHIDLIYRSSIMSRSACYMLASGSEVRLQEETRCELLLCAEDPELLDRLDQAAERGLRVLLTRVERAPPDPALLARLRRSAPRATQPGFRLFLSTHLPVQLLHGGIHPAILARVGVVDLSPSSKEIQELMLSQLLQAECSELLLQRRRLRGDERMLQERLDSQEDSLMDYILQSTDSPLEDSALLPYAAACRDATTRLQAEARRLTAERRHHESLLAAPRQLTELAAAFYRALQNVSRLSPAYYFSLRRFLVATQEALAGKEAPLVSCTARAAPPWVAAEVAQRMTARLLAEYRPSLCRSHWAALELLLSAALLRHGGLCSEAEGAAFLRGLGDLGRPVPTQSTGALPAWIPPHVHPELLLLEEVPVFRGLIASLCTRPLQWREYLLLPSCGVAGPVPCPSHAHLSVLQRALLWRTVVPGCLGGLAQAVAAYYLSLPGGTEGGGTRRAINPEALRHHLAEHEGPVVLTTARHHGDDRMGAGPLHFINTLARCATGTPTVEVVCVDDLCDPEVVLSKLRRAAEAGRWFVFNCRLSAPLGQLISSFKEEDVHPGFRLWLIAQQDAWSSIPAAVRASALPLICDPPWDLREEVASSLGQLTSVLERRPPSARSATEAEPLLRCAVFHSVLVQRQREAVRAEGRSYSWGPEDLSALLEAHLHVAALCHDSAEALRYIAVHLVHGGHVLHSADLELVDCVAKTYLSGESPLCAGGPDAFCDETDWSALLQALQRSLAGPLGLDDPGLLGFSADEVSERIQINSHDLSDLLRASQTPLGAARSPCSRLREPAALPALAEASERLQVLKDRLQVASEPAAAPGALLLAYLQAERDHLLREASSLLRRLRRLVRLDGVSFDHLLQLADLPLLERRAELLAGYLGGRGASDPPGAYRLSAFRNARGLLVALMREAARSNHQHVGDVALHAEVLSHGAFLAPPPPYAVYLCGLQLSGASWDTRLGALREAPPPVVPRWLPILRLEARVRGPDADPLGERSIPLVAPPSPSPLYCCPIYAQGGGRVDDILATLPLPTGMSPVMCGLRRVALTSAL
ncbi:dynein heavy chain domain-containing protein 1 isoform 2-T5 [Spinachia spinachia]